MLYSRKVLNYEPKFAFGRANRLKVVFVQFSACECNA